MSKVYSSVRLFLQTTLRGAACLVALFVFTAVASAATIIVNTATDTNANNGLCTLREAIANANADSQAGSTDCAAGSVADTITFALPAGINTITLTSELTINNAATAGALMITNSPGTSNPLISGNDLTRVFFVSPGANLTLNGITVTRGFASLGGGGIVNDNGTLTLMNSTVSENTSTSGGGGILNYFGTTTLTNSTVSGNTATSGGGIYNDNGTLTLMNSTISENTSTSFGGGGIHNRGSLTSTLTNSTISGNRTAGVGGGIFIDSGTVNLTNVTVAFNSTAIVRGSGGGGVYNGFGRANLSNTIVAKNTSGAGPDFFGLILSGSFNLIGDGTGMSGITNGMNGNQVGTALIPINPMLGPLTLANGGQTPTHAVLAGSTALDAGSNAIATAAGLTTDQRGTGFPRIRDGNGDLLAIVDIGAFEAPLGTTAATVSISGRVTSITGRGILNVRLSLTDSLGQVRTATTNSLGYYRFDDVEVGSSYIITATGKRYSFSQPSQLLNVNEETTKVNFIANSEKRRMIF